MMLSKKLLHAALAAALGFLPVACAQRNTQSGGSGMQGHGMQGMDMQTMMNQCADMRRQMAQGAMSNSPNMRQMMAQCDEMDRGMGTGSAAPAAPRAR